MRRDNAPGDAAAPASGGATGSASGVVPGDVVDTASAEASGGALGTVISGADLAAVEAQLGREPRGIVAVAHRCECGLPDVVTTAPRLPDGTPFPTLYYLTCPKATSAVGRLEAAGVMRDMTERLASDPALTAAYRAAHEDYLRRRAEIAEVPEIDDVSAGGMPDRVKCLHVHLAHALAAGPGVNPFGDETRELVGGWWQAGRCVEAPAAEEGR